MRTLALPLVLGALACGGGGSSGPRSEPANPCATKGATYLEAFTEVSGNCGPLSSQVVNVNPDGTITTSTPLTCASANQTGCTAQDTDCTFTSQGITFTMTFKTTFAQDGSSATGVATISGTGNGQSCSETYGITFTRQ